MLTALATALFPLLALAPAAPPQTGIGCPNVCATNMPARVKNVGPVTHCGFGLVIFGLPIKVGGPKCYQLQFIYPAHQECLGAANQGTSCVPADDLAVQLNTCKCTTLGALGTGIAMPECSCESAGTAGTIEDAQTVLCHRAQ
jgi:hypothetical protein